MFLEVFWLGRLCIHLKKWLEIENRTIASTFAISCGYTLLSTSYKIPNRLGLKHSIIEWSIIVSVMLELRLQFWRIYLISRSREARVKFAQSQNFHRSSFDHIASPEKSMFFSKNTYRRIAVDWHHFCLNWAIDKKPPSLPIWCLSEAKWIIRQSICP